MSKKLWCWLGFHSDTVDDWDSDEGRVRCVNCGRVEPMTGEVLAEWIRYCTTRRELKAIDAEIKRRCGE